MTRLLLLPVLLAISWFNVQAASSLDLERGFREPPESARPWVYWFWLNGNVTAEGITADLEAMHKAGLGGALWMWGGGVGGDVSGPVKFMDAQWWELMRHTIREADRLGLQLNLTCGSGWSHSGGPWVSPEHSMRRLELAQEFRLQGPSHWETAVAPGGPLVAVVAYPVSGSVTNHDGKEVEILASGPATNLTAQINAQRLLAWEVPSGPWSVQVFRHGSTGERPHPILPGEGGWECDKLDPAAVEENWRGFVLRVLNEGGPAARRVVRYTHADSYEFGPQTWTPRFREEFQQRCGYDPIPYMPAVLGRTVDSTEVTTRFLWDFRRVRADLFAKGIGGHLRDLCRREGVQLTTEPHLIPEVFDQIQYGGHVAEPVGNFLAERRTQHYAVTPPVGPEIHLAKGEASSAAVYGLDGVVWAEAFTGVDHAHAWKETPEYLRTWGDLWLTEGINRFCFHCWAHSPSLTQRPGITLGPWGIHFDRRNSWFDLAGGYVSYLSRSQFLLQQGQPIADVAFFTGDSVTTEFPRHPELRAAGYDYHGLTAEVLREAQVQDGQIVLPSGMRYRLLVTYNETMRPRTLQKLRDLVQAGATVVGMPPADVPGLVGYPQSGNQVRQLATELWGASRDGMGVSSVLSQSRRSGRGKVFTGAPEQPAASKSGCGVAAYLSCRQEIATLQAIGVPPDFEYGQSGKEDGDHMLAYIHRRVGQTDLYFVSNQAPRSRSESCTFRISGRQPELWDPVTGDFYPLPSCREQNGRTTIPLEFASGQSFFIVFRQPARKSPSKPEANFAPLQDLTTVGGPWEVSFDPHWGGPDKPVIFRELSDWSNHADDGIRHYSGLATYRKTVAAPAVSKDRRIYLDLGRVKDLAEVRLNGKSVGVVWCAPWRIDVTRALRPGTNALEIVVANQWVNRLIGDSALPAEKRITWTTWNPYKPDSPLLESGLLGPVTLKTCAGAAIPQP